MAEIWLGEDEVLRRPVAVKLLHPNLATDTVFVERLRREAIAAAGIGHPGIVEVFDTISDDGHEAVVMEYVRGLTLRQMLDERGTLSVEETLRIGVSVADALQAAHEAGFVHRDVKPGNILVTDSGRVRLTDFGIATAMLAVDELGDEGVLLGTAKYVAPEQVQGHLVDGRSDLYSLAIVLTECLTGQVPFDGLDERAVALARLRHVPPPVRQLRPDVPPELDRLLSATLQIRPSDRPATAAILRDALARIAAAPQATANPGNGSGPDATRPLQGTKPMAVDPTPPFGTPSRVEPDEEPGLPTPTLATDQRVVTWVVVGMLVVAILVSLVLLALPRRGPTVEAGAPATVVSTTAPATTRAPVPTTAVVRPANAMAIVSSAEFDPDPGNGKENPEELGLLTDGRPETTWSTVCYKQSTMAPKKGVGLVFQLTAPARGHTLVIDSPNEAWAASVYVAESFGARLRDWGQPVTQRRKITSGEAHFELGGLEARYVLLWITDLGEPTCTALPYQLRVGEVTVVQA
jgi:serine/threonine-protein kinase